MKADSKPTLDGCSVCPPMNPLGEANRQANSKPSKAKRKESAGRFQCTNAFIDATMGTLPPAALAVWLILWRDTKPNGLSRTSQADMARRAGKSERAIRSALRVLVHRGLLTVVFQGNLRRGISTYRVHALDRETPACRKRASG
jgi:hypothetical protein